MSHPHGLPGHIPYVLPAGGGLSHLVANQIVRTIASTEETGGGFGAVVCDCPLDRFPVPMHWHEREHDTWFVTRGKLQVWGNDESRILSPGDFAYVQPGDIHSYMSVAPRTRFFGVVAPGGWEAFFGDAGEVWSMTALPPNDRPVDFARMGGATAKHRIMRVEDPVYGPATAISAGDQVLPDRPASYFLEAGFGPRRSAGGHIATTLLTNRVSTGLLEMRTVEGGRGATVPAIRHAATHILLYMLDGLLELELAGKTHRLASGDTANIPVGTIYATRILSGDARWIVTSAGGNGAAFWDEAGVETDAFSHAAEEGPPFTDAITALADVDVSLA